MQQARGHVGVPGSASLGPAQIRGILARIARGSAKGVRDAALILLGFAFALRRSELAALTLADIGPSPTACC